MTDTYRMLFINGVSVEIRKEIRYNFKALQRKYSSFWYHAVLLVLKYHEQSMYLITKAFYYHSFLRFCRDYLKEIALYKYLPRKNSKWSYALSLQNISIFRSILYRTSKITYSFIHIHVYRGNIISITS